MIRKAMMVLGVFVSMIVCMVSAPQAAAKHMAIEYNHGEYSTQGVRLAIQPRVEYELPWWNLSWYPEASISQWNQRHEHGSDKVNVVAIAPVFIKPMFMLGSGHVSFEFGIGASLLDERFFGHKNLGTHFQFEDRLGLRWVSASGDSVSLRYMHYSNGGIGSHNPGVDFINLSYGRNF